MYRKESDNLKINLSKLSELLRKQNTSSTNIKVKQLLLCTNNHVSVSTQSSSRFYMNSSLKQSKIKVERNQACKEGSLSREIKKSKSYGELHTIKQQFQQNDGYCGLKKILQHGKY
ncbi:hypothetical protein pb186bvf_019155 [Paramecium bursaria]